MRYLVCCMFSFICNMSGSIYGISMSLCSMSESMYNINETEHFIILWEHEHKIAHIVDGFGYGANTFRCNMNEYQHMT